MISAAVLLSCLAGWLALTWHDEHFRTYQSERRIATAPLLDWQQNPALRLPRFRDDLRGARDHPLNLALAGDPQCLLHRLSERGWQPAQMLDWHNLLRLLSPRSELSHLPVLPQVHGAAHERSVFSKEQADGSRLLLRLWSTDIRLQPGAVPLLIGNVSRQSADSLLHLLLIPRTEKDFMQPFMQLLDDLGPLAAQVTGPDSSRLLIDLTGERACAMAESATTR
jgi:hypothetical protein